MKQQTELAGGIVAQPVAAAVLRQRGATNWLAGIGRLARRDPLALAGIVVLLLVVLGALLAPFLTPYSATVPNIRERLLTPSLAHPFGTDELGRDLLTRALYGARPILIVGVASVLCALLIGTTIGLFSGYRGGILDELLMRVMDIVLSFPAILFAILIVASLGAGLTNSIIAITFSMIPLFARLGRAMAISLARNDYVLAAHCLGCRESTIISQHILPNMAPVMLVQATSMLAVAFSTSAALSFLGLGVPPPTPDWGAMVSDGQRLVFDAPHVPFFPGLLISLTVLSVNFLGDALRDQLDPLLRQR